MNGWKPYECDACGAKIYSRSGLDHHKWLQHDECPGSVVGAAITFRCAFCSAAFTNRRDLLAHLGQHGKGKARSTPGAKRPRRRFSA